MSRLLTFVFVCITLPVFSQTHDALKTNSIIHVFRLKPHEDLKKSIMDWAAQNKVKAGVIVTCVGSLEQYNLRFANQQNGTAVSGHFEIVSLVGTFSDSKAHLHLSIADSTGRTIGGHLLDECLIYTTAEIAIAELTDIEFTQQLDPIYGYDELKVKVKETKRP